ncbi:hypothetical protein CsatA_007533 [Cannabis sativa]
MEIEEYHTNNYRSHPEMGSTISRSSGGIGRYRYCNGQIDGLVGSGGGGGSHMNNNNSLPSSSSDIPLSLSQVSEELKRLTSTKSSYNGLRFISNEKQGWDDIEKRFHKYANIDDGLLHRSLFGKCIGMDDEEDKNPRSRFAMELFDALIARKRSENVSSIDKAELRKFWDRITDESFDSRMQTFFDMVDKDIDGLINKEDVKNIIEFSASENKLLNIYEHAEEYATLIMEELDPNKIGKIELKKLEDLFHRSMAPSSRKVKEKLVETTVESNTINRYHKRVKHLVNNIRRHNWILEENWRRIWVMGLWLAICACLFTWKFIQYRNRAVFEVMGYCVTTAKGAAETLKFNMALILLPVCRNTITLIRTETKLGALIPFNDNIEFHTVIAGGIAIGVGVHALAHLTCDFPRLLHATDEEYQPMAQFFGKERPNNYWWFLKGTEGWTGLVMVVLMAITFTLAQSWFRKNKSKLPKALRLWYSHHLFVIVYVLFLVHGYYLYFIDKWYKKTTWMYVLVPILLYVCERSIRAFRYGFQAVKILKFKVYPENVLALQMLKPRGFEYSSGQYIYLNCSAISPFEWHPFSLTSAPDDDYLSVHIRGLGDWTKELNSTFSKLPDINLPPISSNQSIVDGQVNKIPRLLIDGAYGAPAQDYKQYKVILLIGGGIGVTPLMSIVKDVLNNRKQYKEDEKDLEKGINNCNNKKKKRKPFATKQVYFYWSTRDEGSFKWFKEVMDEITENGNDGVIEVHNYCTSVYEEGDARSAFISMLQTLYHAKNNGLDIVSNTAVKTNFGRPKWYNAFKNVAAKHANQQIVCCLSVVN